MSDAFAPIVRARPNPIFGRPVHQGSPPFDYSPILLLKPFGFRIAPDTLSSGSSSADFPVSPVIRPTLLRRFRAGTRRASPVAQHVLVTVLSLPPRQGEQPRRSDFGCSCRLRPYVAGSALGDTHFRGHNAFTFVTAR